MLSTLKRKANVDVLPTRIEEMHKLTSLSGKSFFLTLSAVVSDFPSTTRWGPFPGLPARGVCKAGRLCLPRINGEEIIVEMAFPVVPYG